MNENFIEEAALGAVALLIEELRDPPSGVIPVDTGSLQDSLTIPPPVVADNQIRFTATFRAEHGEILNRLRVIRPTMGDVLAWPDGNAGTIFARFIDNERHFRWFSDRWIPFARRVMGGN